MANGRVHREGDPELVSVVVPAHNEEGNLEYLYERVAAALEGFTWELMVVDDGSTDRTYETIVFLADRDSRVRGLSFSRNFGHQYALLAGLKAARGDVVISMDADLQHPPELLPQMIESWRQGFNIVHTKRETGTTLPWFKRATSRFYYRIFSIFTGLSLEEGQSDFRLLDRRVVHVLLGLEQAELFLRGLVYWVGYRHTTLSYSVKPRHSGKSKYTFLKMLAFAAQGLTAFSTLPLRLGVVMGMLTSLFAVGIFVYVLLTKFFGEPVPGWASVAGLISLLFAVSFGLIGFMGIYLSHVFARVQRMPQFIVETSTEEALGRGAARKHRTPPDKLVVHE